MGRHKILKTNLSKIGRLLLQLLVVLLEVLWGERLAFGVAHWHVSLIDASASPRTPLTWKLRMSGRCKQPMNCSLRRIAALWKKVACMAQGMTSTTFKLLEVQVQLHSVSSRGITSKAFKLLSSPIHYIQAGSNLVWFLGRSSFSSKHAVFLLNMFLPVSQCVDPSPSTMNSDDVKKWFKILYVSPASEIHRFVAMKNGVCM